MGAERKIKVLVLDDSLLFREVLARGLESHPLIIVVAKASDPYDARDKILEFKPDVMTCDIQMPRMNGIEFIKKLMPQYPMPVIVASTVSEKVFEALNAGALDFVQKPDVQSPKSVESFIKDMIDKILIASKAKINKPTLNMNTIIKTEKLNQKFGIIAIGASTGGTEAISNLLKALKPDIPGIVIVQHIPPIFSRMFSERLNAQTSFNVSEAVSGDTVEAGMVLIAPGDQHLRIKKTGTKYKVECYKGDKVGGHCPSVDVLFSSVAQQAGDDAVGILLTGMGQDGAKGLLEIRMKGGKTIGQDELSSVVYGMPKAAYELGAVQIQSHLGRIPEVLYSILR